MTIPAIGALSIEPYAHLESLPSLSPQSTAQPADFAQWLGEQIGDVNTQINQSQTQLVQLATGENGNLHQVMLELEKAKLAFQLTLQVRNKVLEGYQDIMRMQI